MRQPRPVAGFALHPCLRRLHAVPAGKNKRPRRMALKATQDGDIRIERSINLSPFMPVARSQSQAVRRGIPAQSQFHVMFIVTLRHKRNCLLAGAESPIRLHAGKVAEKRMSGRNRE